MIDATKLEEIFSQALQLSDAEERRKFVEQACEGNHDLAHQALALLSAAKEAGSFLESPVWKGAQALQSSSTTDRIEPTASRTEHSFLAAPHVAGDLGSLGPYRILQRVGQGGMGIVFRAIDPKLQRVVAVKVLAPEIAADPTARRRFEREARSAAAVSHPHVVVIHAVDDAHNPPYLVMEFVQGKTLAEKLSQQGMLSLKEILRIGVQIAEGLAAAHRQGLVHRDMKPANVLLENGVERVKVTDFGLAKIVDDASMTRTGDLSGTPQFMSPEQASGTLIDQRTDLFSLGAILYTMCTGRPPFRADNPLALLKRICEDSPRPIQQVNPEIPEWLSAIVDRLLAKSPVDRYQSAAEVAALLQQHLATIQAGPNILQPARNASSRSAGNGRRLWPWSLLAFILFAGIGAWVWLAPQRMSYDASRPQDERSDSPQDPLGGETPATDKNRFLTAAPSPAMAPFNADQARKHQEDWAAYLKVPVEYTNSIGMKFMLIPPGEFKMGSTQEEIDEAVRSAGDHTHWPPFTKYESPQHTVVLTKPFYIGDYEVTQSQYENVIGENPSAFSSAGAGKGSIQGLDTSRHPVENVNWNDAVAFCVKLSELERLQPLYSTPKDSLPDNQPELTAGNGYRLPTEAEWEYACRAGTTTKYWTGDSDQELAAAAWFAGRLGQRSHPVGLLKANPFGLFDIHGNVWEWVQDWFEPEYYEQFKSRLAFDPLGPPISQHGRTLRGGHWHHYSGLCRAAFRYHYQPTMREPDFGFRVAMSIDGVKASLAQRTISQLREAALDSLNGTTAGERRELTNLKIAFRWCPPGRFMMGGQKSEGHQGVETALPHGFWMQETEVTQLEWTKVMGYLPSAEMNKGKGDQYPIYNVSLDDAAKYCRKLTDQGRQAGRIPSEWEFRLPSEAEWEYACRAGTTTDTAFGDALSSTQANFGGDWPHNGAPKGPSHGRAVKVGSYLANSWGIYDMHGNVKEFTTTAGRVRGGSWYDSGRNCCSGIFIPDPPHASESIGFRVVLAPVP